MGFIRKIIIAILVLSLVTFIALFGSLPRLRKTPIGFANRLIWIKIPSLLLTVDYHLTGGRCTWALKRTGHYLMNENHPLVLFFYVGLLIAAESFFLPAAWSRLTYFQRFTTVLLISLPYVFTYKCVMSTASVVKADNHHELMRQYPYDRVLFQPGQMCRTCNLVKPARSKHCRICNVCIAKHDHHCIWVMNCLGRGNYVFFVAMVLSLAVMLIYGTHLTYLLLDDFLQDSLVRRSQGTDKRSHWGVGRTFSQRIDMWAWAFTEDLYVGCIGMLCLFTAPLAGGLFLYHIYLVWAGMTTNESFKWDEWKEDVADGLVYKHLEVKYDSAPSKDPSLEPSVDWPVTTRQRLINRANGPPLSPVEEVALQKRGWIKIFSLREVDNIYDLGFLDNFRDILRTS